MPFRYNPQWQGPLSGRSFEKQTEDFLNGIETRVDEIDTRQTPSDAMPLPDGTGSAGTAGEYSRGDHVHPKTPIPVATDLQDGLMSSADKAKLDAIPASTTSFSRTTTVLASAVPAGTAISVPVHAVGQGLLFVWQNGVLCEAGAGAQYMDFSATAIKFNYDLPAGDTITAAAVEVSAS